MCLIPSQVLAEIGLSLPLFMKWDDCEFGLRAKASRLPDGDASPAPRSGTCRGPTRTTRVDWQSYFHQRNRFVAALLHSPYPHGGRMIRESLNHQIKHLVSMQYSTAELRLKALEDVLRRARTACTSSCRTELGEVNAFRKQFADAQLQADPDAFPPVRREKPPRKGKDDSEVPSRRSQLITAGLAPIRQLRPSRASSPREFPETELPAMDAKWYRLAPLRLGDRVA